MLEIIVDGFFLRWRHVITRRRLVITDKSVCFLVFLTTGGEPMATVLKPDEIKNLVDIPGLIEDIEAGFVLYCEGRVKV